MLASFSHVVKFKFLVPPFLFPYDSAFTSNTGRGHERNQEGTAKLSLDTAALEGIEGLSRDEAPGLERGGVTRAHGGILRQLHAMLREKDVTFGGLERVQNKRREYLWVHPQFAGEY